jgi:galactokinase
VLGQAGHALLIDCRSLVHEPVALPEGVCIVICDSMKRRGLVDSAYNERRQECQTGVRLLRHHLPGITALRDVTLDDLKQFGDSLPSPMDRRVRHVVRENWRVHAFAEALRQGELIAAGTLMNDSHVSLRDDYAVSCTELDALAEAAWATPGVYGSRMTGAGFGGCTVSLVAEDAVQAFHRHVQTTYEAQTSLEARIYVSRPSQGVSVV